MDRTFALNAAYEEIKAGRWWLPPDARAIDGGELYAQLKAPTRIRDLASGELRYKWTETGPLDHYRHAHAYDFLAAAHAIAHPPAFCMGMAAGELESYKLLADYSGRPRQWLTHGADW